jgi:hypothetical protein
MYQIYFVVPTQSVTANQHRHQALVGACKFPNITFYVFMLPVADDGSLLGFNTIQRYAPHNDVSVNDGGPIRLQYYNTYHCVTIAYSIQYSNML